MTIFLNFILILVFIRDTIGASNDLLHFYEYDLYKGSLKAFENSLPSHLRSMFQQAMGRLTYRDRFDVIELQGYRGPYNSGQSGNSAYSGPSRGLQQVQFRWGMNRDVDAIPIAGAIMLADYKNNGNRDWHSLYFDSKTGEALGHFKELAAYKLNEIGRRLHDSGKYYEAKEYFSNAYEHSGDAAYYKDYKNNEKSAQAEIDAINLNYQGDNLFNQGKYGEAQSKYQAAYDKSQVSNQYNKYSANRNKAKVEVDAINLNSQGDSLFNQGKFGEAQSKYQAAYDKSQVSNQYNKYSANRNKAKVEIEAMNLNSQGDYLFNQGKYGEAQSKYQAAYDKSQVYNQYNKYYKSKNKAKAEIEAMNLNSQGDGFFNQGKYSEAQSKYQAAYEKSQVSNQYNKYSASKNKAKAEIEAMNLNSQGGDLFNQGKYGEAQSKYQAAHDKSHITKEKTIYALNRNQAQVEVEAMNLNIEGDSLFMQNKYSEAQSKYQAAYDKSVVSVQKKKYITNTNKAKYKSVISIFLLMLLPDVTDSKLKEFGIELETMIDEGYNSDIEIVNRYHIISLRIARRKMITQLDSKKQEDFSDLLEAIMNLIETEIKVLKELNITDQKLEQELESLKEKLNTLDNEDQQSNDSNKVVDITTIADKAKKIYEQIEPKILEKLAQETQLEHA